MSLFLTGVRAFLFGAVVGVLCYLLGEAGQQLHADLVPAAETEQELAPPKVEFVPQFVLRQSNQHRRERLFVYCAGVLCEGVANATAPITPLSACSKQFLKQFGVQLQVATLADADLVSTNPAVAFAQGFLVGL